MDYTVSLPWAPWWLPSAMILTTGPYRGFRRRLPRPHPGCEGSSTCCEPTKPALVSPSEEPYRNVAYAPKTNSYMASLDTNTQTPLGGDTVSFSKSPWTLSRPTLWSHSEKSYHAGAFMILHEFYSISINRLVVSKR